MIYRQNVGAYENNPLPRWNETITNKYGHVAICLGMLEGCYIVFEQDGLKQDGAKIKLRGKENLLGYLRKRV